MPLSVNIKAAGPLSASKPSIWSPSLNRYGVCLPAALEATSTAGGEERGGEEPGCADGGVLIEGRAREHEETEALRSRKRMALLSW